MYRYKRIIGDHLRARHREAQKSEALIAVVTTYVPQSSISVTVCIRCFNPSAGAID